MSIKLVEEGLMIEAPGVTLIIPDETFDPILWVALLQCIQEGVIYG